MEARREGTSFDDFWKRAVRPGLSPLITTETKDPPAEAVVWPRDSADRAVALAASRAAKEHWRRAYDGEPQTPGERAFAILASITREATGGSRDRGEVALASAA